MLKNLQDYSMDGGKTKPLKGLHEWMIDAARGSYSTARAKINRGEGSEETVKKSLETWFSAPRAVEPAMAFPNPAEGLEFQNPMFFHKGEDMRKMGEPAKKGVTTLIGEIKDADKNISPEDRALAIEKLAEKVKPIGVGKEYVSSAQENTRQQEEAIQKLAASAIQEASAKSKLGKILKLGKNGIFGGVLGTAFGVHSMIENLSAIAGTGMLGRGRMEAEIQQAVSTAANLKRLSEATKQRTLSGAAVAATAAAGSELNRR
jgi:hypothetical protein